MKVLHLSSEKGWRGGEQQIAYLIAELSKLGVKNYVAARKGSAFETYCINHDIIVFPLPFKNSLDLQTALAVKTISHEYRIELIHMHSSKSHGIGVLSAVFGNKIPLVLSRRVDFVPNQNWFTKWKYDHPSIKRVLCVSGKINEIMHRYLRRPEKSVTVHSGVDLSKFNRSGSIRNKLRDEFSIQDHHWIIGNSSALEAHKDYFTFIKTIEILQKKNIPIHAFIIGTGSLENALKTYVEQLSLQQHITFTGFRNDIHEILPSLDIFLMTSNEEGLGTSVLDAFLAGPAVVATAAGGIPEMVIHERTGLLAPVGDATALAMQIERLIKNGELKNRIVSGAAEKVKDFSKESTASKTFAIYQEVLAKQPAGRVN